MAIAGGVVLTISVMHGGKRPSMSIRVVRAVPETSHPFSLLSAADPRRLQCILIGSGPLLT
jgi:hypothetical protein